MSLTAAHHPKMHELPIDTMRIIINHLSFADIHNLRLSGLASPTFHPVLHFALQKESRQRAAWIRATLFSLEDPSACASVPSSYFSPALPRQEQPSRPHARPQFCTNANRIRFSGLSFRADEISRIIKNMLFCFATFHQEICRNENQSHQRRMCWPKHPTDVAHLKFQSNEEFRLYVDWLDDDAAWFIAREMPQVSELIIDGLMYTRRFPWKTGKESINTQDGSCIDVYVSVPGLTTERNVDVNHEIQQEQEEVEEGEQQQNERGKDVELHFTLEMVIPEDIQEDDAIIEVNEQMGNIHYDLDMEVIYPPQLDTKLISNMLGACTQIRKLVLQSFHQLEGFPSAILQLTGLLHLELIDLPALIRLPKDIGYALIKLRHLKVEQCPIPMLPLSLLDSLEKNFSTEICPYEIVDTFISKDFWKGVYGFKERYPQLSLHHFG